MLQRTKAGVLTKDVLPPRREETVRVEMSAWQSRAYADLKKATLKFLDANSGNVSWLQVNNTMMQLRKITLHPFLFGHEGDEDKNSGRRHAKHVKALIRVSGKFEVLDRILLKLQTAGHKVLVFSQFVTVLDLLEEYLALQKMSCVRIDGQSSVAERQEQVKRFSDSKQVFVFLLSTRAGGLGLNLQAADTVIFFDSDRNPQSDKQAVGRAHRLGQKKEVLVLRLVSRSGVEEHMERRAAGKLEIERRLIGAGEFNQKGHLKTPEARAQFLRELLETK